MIKPENQAIIDQAKSSISRSTIESLFSVSAAYWSGDKYYTVSPLRSDNTVTQAFCIMLKNGAWVYNDFASGDKGDIVDLIARSQNIGELESACLVMGVDYKKNDDIADFFASLGQSVYKERPVKNVQKPEAKEAKREKIEKEFEMGFKYFNNDGGLAFGIDRYILKSGGKTFIVWHYDSENKKQYGMPSQYKVEISRPLYNGTKVKDGFDFILVVEGEKKCRNTNKYFSTNGINALCVSWSGGAQNVRFTDFSNLNSKKCVLWPDNDATGKEAMQYVLKQIQGDVFTVCVDSLEAKADIDDVITNGLDPMSFINDAMNGNKEEKANTESHDGKEKAYVDSNATFTDYDNATLLSYNHTDNLRYCIDDKSWFKFDGCKWIKDGTKAYSAVNHTLQAQTEKASIQLMSCRTKDERKVVLSTIKYLNSASSYNACRSIAEGLMHIDSIAFDTMLNHFPVKNGVVDLKTGELLPHNPNHFFTFNSKYNYDPEALCPKFMKWLHEIMLDRRAISDWLQAFFGYCLTGNTSDHIFPVFYGRGGNGKGTLVNIITEIMGGAATSTGVETIMEKRSENSAHYELAALQGKRFVYAAEPEEGKKLDHGIIKTVTGEDYITCRQLYGSFRSYKPTWKLILQTNDKPIIAGQDMGMWRRLRLIPFDLRLSPSEVKPDMHKKFIEEEAEGILNWMVRGAIHYYKEGLPDCAEITKSTAEYKDDSNIIQNFINEWLELLDFKDDEPKNRVLLKDMVREYTNWAHENGQPEYKGIALVRELTKAGIAKGKSRYGAYFQNVRVLTESERSKREYEQEFSPHATEYNDHSY